MSKNQTDPDFDGIVFDGITVLHAPPGLPVGTFNCTVTRCKNIVMDNIKLLDAPNASRLECKGVTGVQSGVGSRVSCHLKNRTV